MQRNLDIPEPSATTPTSSAPLTHSQLEQSSVIITTDMGKKHTNDTLVQLKEYLYIFMGNWKWFVLSLIIAFSAAYYYLQITPKVYLTTASIMIKADERATANDELMENLGLSSPSININNEIMSIKTINSTRQVVEALNLQVECYRSGAFHDVLAYGPDLPVKVLINDLEETDAATMELVLSSDSTVVLSDFSRNGQPLADKNLKMNLGTTVMTPLGRITVLPSQYYVGGMTAQLHVKRRPLRETIQDIDRRLSVYQRSNRASIIDLSITDVSKLRGEDILTNIIEVYNVNWIKDRNQITAATTEFIRERLSIIEGELGNVDSDISDYKSRNLMTDVGAVGGIALNQKTSSETEARQLDNRLYMTRYLRSYLTDGMHEKEQLPANSGIGNPSIEAQITAYNQLLLQRNNHLAVSSEQNPLVMDIDQKLTTMKQSILGSLDNELVMLNTQRNAISNMRSDAVTRLAANPQQAKYLLSVERQQKVKESLYLFLLQKREENELSQAFTAYNTRVIEYPVTNPVPVEPDMTMVVLLASVLGLVIPAGALITREAFNTSVRGRKDIESIHAPFVGEIPLAMVRVKGNKRRELTPEESGKNLVVKDKSKNIINEAFRVVRTNLEFILGFDNGTHVVMMTSMNPGSGKTFISANLAMALVLKGKKVIAVDLDLRRGSLSKYVNAPEVGVSNYLSGQVSDYHSIICNIDGLDMLPVGTIPPNPTELLFTARFPKLIEALKSEYDYVIIDCPPVEIVADAAIISRYAEMTLFVIRAHLLDRAFLPDIEKWYQEHRFPNLSILLNGTHEEFSHYGYGKYGYHRYGYHYGHYGEYGYTEEEAPESQNKKKQ